jgi:hypothetical protein
METFPTAAMIAAGGSKAQDGEPQRQTPERTRIAYFALLAATTGAALREESRMQITQSHGSPQEIRGQVTKGRLSSLGARWPAFFW